MVNCTVDKHLTTLTDFCDHEGSRWVLLKGMLALKKQLQCFPGKGPCFLETDFFNVTNFQQRKRDKYLSDADALFLDFAGAIMGTSAILLSYRTLYFLFYHQQLN